MLAGVLQGGRFVDGFGISGLGFRVYVGFRVSGGGGGGGGGRMSGSEQLLREVPLS